MTAIEVLDPSDDNLADLSDDELLAELLRRWHEQALAMWKLTAQIGDILKRHHDQLPEDEWPVWLQERGLTLFAGYVFLRAREYPNLLHDHKPQSLADVQRWLPPLVEGAAYDREMMARARRLHESGMSKRNLRINLGVSDQTLMRWLEPDRYAQRKEREAEKRAEAARRVEQREQQAFLRSLKLRSREAAVAQELAIKLSQALDAGGRSVSDRESRAAFNEAYAHAMGIEECLKRLV